MRYLESDKASFVNVLRKSNLRQAARLSELFCISRFWWQIISGVQDWPSRIEPPDAWRPCAQPRAAQVLAECHPSELTLTIIGSLGAIAAEQLAVAVVGKPFGAQ